MDIRTPFLRASPRLQGPEIRGFGRVRKALETGGEGGIRTPGGVAPTPHFECGAFDHSATSPRDEDAVWRPVDTARLMALMERRCNTLGGARARLSGGTRGNERGLLPASPASGNPAIFAEPPMPRFFVYGTLRDPDLLAVLLGRPLVGRRRCWRRWRRAFAPCVCRERAYPALVLAPGGVGGGAGADRYQHFRSRSARCL